MMSGPGKMAQNRVNLTRRARMYHVELMAVFPHELQRVSLVELKRIPGHGLMVNAHNLEACPVITHRRTPCSAEQIQ